MKTWMIIAYAVASLVVTAGILMGAWLTFFVNPINWKNYTDYRTIDYVVMWGSNGLIAIMGIALVLTTWWGFWKLTRRMANKAPHLTRGLAAARR